MQASSSEQRRLVDENMRARVSDLLERYPDITEPERAEIIRFLKKAPALDVGLLSANETIRPQLTQFKLDHEKEVGVGLVGLAMAAVIVLILALFTYFLWG